MTRLQDLAAQLSGYDPDALPVAQAQAFIARLVPCVTEVDNLPLRSALGRVLARDIVSPINVPAHDNSAMDGYALRSHELASSAPSIFTVAGRSVAGAAFGGTAACGQCVRITTGAVMPAGFDSVVPQEVVQVAADGTVTVPPGVVQAGDNRRLAGEDLRQGEPALQAGRVLRPADLGLLASLSRAEVPVFRRLRVAFFSTGNELRSVGDPLDEGCVYDSNRYTLWGMLTRLGVEPIDMGVVPDDPAALDVAFRQAAETADAVITSGGVSVGDTDHTRQVMARLGPAGRRHAAGDDHRIARLGHPAQHEPGQRAGRAARRAVPRRGRQLGRCAAVRRADLGLSHRAHPDDSRQRNGSDQTHRRWTLPSC